MSNESKCRDCGETLVWDDKNLTANGKKFPVEKNGNRHNCPLSKFNKNQDKSLGDRTALEALGYLMSEMTNVKKRLDGLEIDKNWGQYKTGTVPEPKPKGEIDWEGLRTKESKIAEHVIPDKTKEDPWGKFKQ